MENFIKGEKISAEKLNSLITIAEGAASAASTAASTANTAQQTANTAQQTAAAAAKASDVYTKEEINALLDLFNTKSLAMARVLCDKEYLKCDIYDDFDGDTHWYSDGLSLHNAEFKHKIASDIINRYETEYIIWISNAPANREFLFVGCKHDTNWLDGITHSQHPTDWSCKIEGKKYGGNILFNSPKDNHNSTSSYIQVSGDNLALCQDISGDNYLEIIVHVPACGCKWDEKNSVWIEVDAKVTQQEILYNEYAVISAQMFDKDHNPI